MNFKKFLSLLCAITMLFSSTFCCKAEDKCNVVFFGDTNTGKTQIVRRLCRLEFEQEHNPTIGSPCYKIQLNDNTYNMYDITGNEFNEFLFLFRIDNSDMMIFVCHLNDPRSIIYFERCMKLYERGSKSGNKNIILVGNMSDSITPEVAKSRRLGLIDLARQRSVPDPEKRVVLVNAYTGDGIENLKELIIEFTPKLKQDIPEPEGDMFEVEEEHTPEPKEGMPNPTNIYDNSASKTKNIF